MLVGELLGDLVDGVLGEGDACVFGLEAVDEVAEDPAAAADALSVAALLAEATAPAGGHAGEQHPVAGGDRGDGGANLLDGADGLVAEDRAGRGLGHVALEDVQVGAADRGGVDAHDRVGRLDQGRVGDRVPTALAGAVIDEGLHLFLLSLRDCGDGGGSLRRGSGWFIGGPRQRRSVVCHTHLSRGQISSRGPLFSRGLLSRGRATGRLGSGHRRPVSVGRARLCVAWRSVRWCFGSR